MTSDARTIRVEAIARVEGEGGVRVVYDGDRLVSVELSIYEPPRFFEGFLRGRHASETPDLTARICGICPVAYQMSACLAVEDACGVTVGGPIAELRRLLYAGEWIESHALHIVMLHAPDLLGCADVIGLSRDHPDRVEAGLRLKQIGNRIMEVVGGRPIHPVNVRVGGFHRWPEPGAVDELRADIDEAIGLARRLVEWTGSLEVPDATIDADLVALTDPDPDRYAVVGGRLRSTSGLACAVSEFGDHLVEHQVPHSTALHATLDGRTYLVGPLSRFVLNHAALHPEARAAADGIGLGPETRNPHRTIAIRAVEVLQAALDARRILDLLPRDEAPSVPCEYRSGTGNGWTEAPRGLLHHRYELADDGTIRRAVIVPPTSQNQAVIERTLRLHLERHPEPDDAALGRACEQLIRTFDPCISCATHFLDLTVTRRPPESRRAVTGGRAGRDEGSAEWTNGGTRPPSASHGPVGPAVG